ncbi:DUF4267 domain-containing protein [Sphaerisporangium corydalis]|uniref:DUF4267 domain-containing protein n=1 Tax=Sphaerisporangium corydalis TaxID=1441875 RepID=A0ABV9E8A2_9ACTN|nr:DUF4267 domain-containing protein [Sphaerisporangium corydalis]
MKGRGWLRAGLCFLILYHLVFTGLWPLLLPQSFYDGFPLPRHAWVAMLPPFNEHLLRDFGALNISIAAILGVSAFTMDRRLVMTVLVAGVVFAIPHMIFHAAHLDNFPPPDAIAQTILLALMVVLPVVLLPLAYRLPRVDRLN